MRTVHPAPPGAGAAFAAPDAGAVTPHVVVIDEAPASRGILTDYFGRHGMRTAGGAGSADLLQHLRAEPSLVVLDLDAARSDSLDLLRLIRVHSDVPVVIVTGERCEETDRVVGFELGADDYLIKPFGLRELLARVRAILRRRTRGDEAPRAKVGRRVRFGPWELDRVSRRLERDGASPVTLTKGEFALLHAFLDAPQRVLSREHLLRATRVHEDVFDRSIDVQVLRLRRKLEANGGPLGLIETIRGTGYVLRAQVEAPGDRRGFHS